MLYSDTLISYRNDISGLKNDVFRISKQLDSAIENIQESANAISNCFIINDNSADNKSIKKIAQEIISIRDELNTSVVSSINSEVNSLNNKIDITKIKEEKSKKGDKK